MLAGGFAGPLPLIPLRSSAPRRVYSHGHARVSRSPTVRLVASSELEATKFPVLSQTSQKRFRPLDVRRQFSHFGNFRLVFRRQLHTSATSTLIFDDGYTFWQRPLFRPSHVLAILKDE